jgi:hypothetical protein
VITALCVNIIAFFLVTVVAAALANGKTDHPLFKVIGWWYLAITVLAIITLALA